MSRRARKIYALDCETDPFKAGRVPQPFLWGLYDGENYEEFETVLEVVERLQGEAATVYAHNGGKFDYHYLREYINTDESIMLIGGRLAKFRIGECEFRDSMNLFTFALAAYQKETIDYALMEADVRNDPNNRAIISRYLRSDCVNLFELVSAFFKSYGRSLTQAGAAMRVWSKMSQRRPPRQTVTQYNAHKDYYYGGRVECFVSGNARRRFSVVDINSAYPYAMLHEHPISCDSESMGYLPGDSEIARCFIRFEGHAVGALPYIDEDHKERKLTFPKDEQSRIFSITGWELIAALEANAVRIDKILDVRRFEHTINFKDYVDRFFALKLKAKLDHDKAQELFAKIFLNALYGKFAANPLNYLEYVLCHLEDLDAYLERGFDMNSAWGADRLLMQRQLSDEKQRFYNVATAASITGFVRAHLFKSLQACKGVLYCDTDSIAADDVSALKQGNELGAWKLEMECDEFAVGGKKVYAYHKTPEWLAQEGPDAKEWKTASKGTKLTAAQIVEVAQGKTVTFSPEVPTYSIHRPQPIFISRTVRNTAVLTSGVSL